ncbi:MAG: hypothetical protein DRI57_04580 [Deltaproteobacteria bacterium]|nr:MAG: hypothetical protein DRI57_04580 [Deltaproteobacteria bacterium]
MPFIINILIITPVLTLPNPRENQGQNEQAESIRPKKHSHGFIKNTSFQLKFNNMPGLTFPIAGRLGITSPQIRT